MSDVGVYGLVDLDAFQGRDDTIRKAIKKSIDCNHTICTVCKFVRTLGDPALSFYVIIYCKQSFKY